MAASDQSSNGVEWDVPTRPAEGVLWDDDIDTHTGAPLGIRHGLSAAKTPQDKLQFLQQYYPDAKPYEDTFLFTNPATNRQTMVNPPGFELGSLAAAGRPTAEMVGGSIGGAAALIAGQAGPQAATPEEVYTVPAGVALGATTAGKIYDSLIRGMYDVQDSRSAAQIVGEDSVTAIANGTGLAAGKALANVLRSTVVGGRQVLGGAEDLVRGAFAAIDAPVTAGTTTGSRTMQGVEQGISRLPLATDVMADKYTNIIDAMDTYATGAADRLSRRSGETAVGESIQKGVAKHVENFKAQSGVLYDQFFSRMPANSRMPVSTFKSTLDDIMGDFSADPQFAGLLETPLVKTINEAAEMGDGTIAVSTAKALRTMIGKKTGDSIIGSTAQGDMKRLYAALSDDLAEAAGQVDGAAEAFTRANTFYREGRKRIDGTLGKLVKDDHADMVYRGLFGPDGKALKNFPGSKMSTLLDSIPIRHRKAVMGEIVRRMGKPTSANAGHEGAVGFSPAVFARQYGDLPAKTKQALFKHDPSLRAALDNLSIASNALKDSAKMANPSGTAGMNVFMSLLTGATAVGGYQSGGLAGAAATTATTTLGPYGVAKLMTNARFVNWLAGAARARIQSPNDIGPVIGRLAAVFEAEPEIQQELQQYMTELEKYQEAPDATLRKPDK